MEGLADLDSEIRKQLTACRIDRERLAGRRIAVTAGSRGIANLKEIVRAMCGWLREQGAEPFVIPAMGSHGGATPEGQRRILEGYGVREDFVGAPIRSSMETVTLGETAKGFQVFMSRDAWEADGVLVMNRVKPHTDFSGKIESGRLKMIAVGMGKQTGAHEVHRWARKYGYEEVIRAMAEHVLARGKIVAGVAVVENELHQICQARAALPKEMIPQEEEALALARRLVPKLPFPSVQLLIVDEMGKNISGTGMDTKVIGRSVKEGPQIDMIYVRDLTAASEGNATGVGNADLIHERFFQKVDLKKTYVNALTSLKPSNVRLPMHLASDREAIDVALGSIGAPEPQTQRVAWIRNTLDLGRIALSEPLAAESANLPGWSLSPERFEPRFDGQGNLAPLLQN
ncbi:MAG: lactate racemase domain-containing protein [Terriglobia bacterium]